MAFPCCPTSASYTSAAGALLDAADGVIDGKFFGAKIVDAPALSVSRTYQTAAAYPVMQAAPVYKTPVLGTSATYGATYSAGSLGLTGALGGISGYSCLPSYPAVDVSCYSSGLSALYPTVGLGASYVGGLGLGLDCASYGLCGASNLCGASSYCYPTMTVPQVSTVQQYQVVCPAPPPVQLIECRQEPQVQVLQLPAPCPPPPAPLPPPPSVIHIKDDNGPKIASLQAEIRRLERLLATAKETEAALRAEIQELHVKIEIWAQKDVQTVGLEAELARLREQLMEAQRRIVFLEGQRDEAHKHIAFLESQLKAADERIAQMAAHIRALETEIANLRMRLEVKQEVHSRTNIHETYKVKTFEMAAKLAVLDGTDDGLYNGLPIEVEGEGLYRDLVRAGRRPRENVSLTGRSSMTTTSETYKVQNLEMAEKLSKMDGIDNGMYNGLPIEVAGLGLYSDIVKRRVAGGSTSWTTGAAAGSYTTTSGGVRTTTSPPRVLSASGGIAGGSYTTTSGGVRTTTSPPRVLSASGGISGARTGSVTTTGAQTYKVSNMEMAAKISRMGGADDGTYKGLPIEVQGLGLYRDLRGKV